MLGMRDAPTALFRSANLGGQNVKLGFEITLLQHRPTCSSVETGRWVMPNLARSSTLLALNSIRNGLLNPASVQSVVELACPAYDSALLSFISILFLSSRRITACEKDDLLMVISQVGSL